MRRKEDRIRVVLCRPGKLAQEAWIRNTEEDFEKELEGPVKPIFRDDPIFKGLAIVIDRFTPITHETKNRTLTVDRNGLTQEIICGAFFVAGYQGGDFTSLTEDQADAMLDRFFLPERFERVAGWKPVRYTPKGGDS